MSGLVEAVTSYAVLLALAAIAALAFAHRLASRSLERLRRRGLDPVGEGRAGDELGRSAELETVRHDVNAARATSARLVQPHHGDGGGGDCGDGGSGSGGD